MLTFLSSDTNVKFYVTLNEARTITDDCYYLMIFTNILTKDTVKVIYSTTSDESEYPKRYNEFSMNVATIFSGQQTGDWVYDIYEQTSDSNLDPTLATGIVEQGKMRLKRATAFSYTTLTDTVANESINKTTYKTYDGQY